jgi:hypothetical protein
MIRALVFLAWLTPSVALAQSAMEPPAGTDAHHMMMMRHMQVAATGAPTQPGQSAFAAIQEIVRILEADPATDWSKVNIDALRQHLVDMDNVTLRAQVESEPIEGGLRFTISGAGPVKDSIQRIVIAHAAVMNGADGWKFTASPTETGALLDVVTPSKDKPKLRALGFFGLMTLGMHHQMHHLMIARGENPHG